MAKRGKRKYLLKLTVKDITLVQARENLNMIRGISARILEEYDIYNLEAKFTANSEEEANKIVRLISSFNWVGIYVLEKEREK